MFDPLFRIHDILLCIRIRILIRGSMPWLIDLDAGSRSFYFRHWPSSCPQKTNFKKSYQLIAFWRYIYIIFQRKKVQKKSQNSRNQGFSYYVCLLIEGSGSGSIPLTNGSGSGRPKNMWIQWIRIRIWNWFEQLSVAQVPLPAQYFSYLLSFWEISLILIKDNFLRRKSFFP